LTATVIEWTGRNVRGPKEPVVNSVCGKASGLGLLAALAILAGPTAQTASMKAESAAAKRSVRVAGIVLKWVRGERDVNFRRLERQVLDAAASGAKIVCTTECFLDGNAAESPNIGLADLRALAEEIPEGAYFRRLAALAAKAKVHLVAGLVEREGASCYDATVFLGPDGKLIGKSRKQKLERAESRLTVGAEAPVFATPYGAVGILIDGDRTDPAIVRRCYAKGAQILFCPSGVWGSVENILKVQARSRENNLFIVCVHPTAFLATGPDGATRKRELFEGPALVKPEEVGGDHDQNGIVYFDLPTRPPDAATEITAATFRPMEGQALFYRSSVFGELQPLAVCTTDVSATPKPLLVQLTSLAFAQNAARGCEAVCRLARDHGLDCVVLSVDGRGGGSLHQGYGEVDVYEAIAAVRQKLAIDPDRISVTGSSVGGAATWYHASHYPDFWAAAAPMFGYCDHKISEGASLTSFPRYPWEEDSWIARGAAYRAANLRHIALRFAHGEWDRAVPGGVPVEHSRQMDRKLTALGIPHTYIEVPKTGHFQSVEVGNETVLWLLKQQRVRSPADVSLVVHTLRHPRSHWVAVEQQAVYGKESTVEARRRSRGAVVATTANVRRLALGPLADAGAIALDLDGQSFAKTDLNRVQYFTRAKDGAWARANGGIAAGEKRPGLSGPFSDLFIAPTIIVYGLSGSTEASQYNEQVAFGMARHFSQWNGGLHRGSIPGNNNVLLPVVSDRHLLELLADGGPDEPVDLDCRLPGDYAKVSIDKAILRRANLLIIGNTDSNAVLEKLAPRLPVRFGPGKLMLGGKTFAGDHLGCFAVFPHPDGQRYVGLLSGNVPDAITWGSRVGLQLLPDYLVFDQARVVDWGFWKNHWRLDD
jgi:predicted amidohydrolase/pimeloyl-ACP methyl ester carboxylesterase